jgi:uncharacterized protein (DUF608 family)
MAMGMKEEESAATDVGWKRLPLRKLIRRAEAEVFRGEELRYIGMPIGGFFAGTVYLGGDGQLWNWDIFNQVRLGCVDRSTTQFMGDTLTAMGGSNYVDPVRQQSPIEQKWQVAVGSEKPRPVRFGSIAFRGEYPVGRISLSQADADIELSVEAFSPFCPLNAEDSSYPATTLTFTATNVGDTREDVTVSYQAQNPVLLYSRKTRADYSLQADRTSHGIAFSAVPRPSEGPSRAAILFQDWSSGSYGRWAVEGTAFGDAPQRVSDLPSYMGSVDAGTEFVVNSHQTRNGEDVVQADVHRGTLTSPEFVIDRECINLRVGGGSHAGTCVRLLVEGRTVRSVSGRDSNAMRWASFAVGEFQGKTARLQVVDEVDGPWGQIALGEVEFSDQPRYGAELESVEDYGSFCIEALEDDLTVELSAEFGKVAARLELEPGQSRSVTFVISWHFPNCAGNLPGKRHWYAGRWANARAVAKDLRENWNRLRETTLAWNRTWYDSTLPHWFLDRTFVNTSILATTTCYRLDEGRYYFWEGVGCCPGTCTHVWGYAQAIGRVFPEIERYLRAEIDYGIAYNAETGAIDYRAEYHRTVAVDGQASCILRAYREHLMSRDDRFLQSIWPHVKGSMQYLLRQDTQGDGILRGAQYNTLDTAWYGEIAWISGLYVAALRACEAMAKEMDEPAFAVECAKRAKQGSSRLVSDLFTGEYFIHRIDPAHPEANNTNDGCHIDQVYGQSWAMQVGLPRVIPVRESRSALAALYRYSFHEDVWDYRRKNRAIPGGRWYAVPGEPGLIMCSFPRGGAEMAAGKSGDAWAVGYFNECMSGFEYQVASHMIAEGMVEEGMNLVRAIHDRYRASQRNPYNEVECSDHYGRAMASYGAYVALTGFWNHGPRGEMRFSPKLRGKAARFAFINERGWGTYERSSAGKETVQYVYLDGELVRRP